MEKKRTSGITALGVANIVLGAIGAIGSNILLFVAIGILAAPTFLDPTRHPDIDTLSSAKRVAIGLLFLGLVRVTLSILLIVAGVLVLAVSPKGRRLSVGVALTWTLVNVGEMFLLGDQLPDRLSRLQLPFVWFLLMTIYPAIVELLFMKKSWRDVFATQN